MKKPRRRNNKPPNKLTLEKMEVLWKNGYPLSLISERTTYSIEKIKQYAQDGRWGEQPIVEGFDMILIDLRASLSRMVSDFLATLTLKKQPYTDDLHKLIDSIAKVIKSLESALKQADESLAFNMHALVKEAEKRLSASDLWSADADAIKEFLYTMEEELVNQVIVTQEKMQRIPPKPHESGEKL